MQGLPTGGEESGENGPRQEAEQPSVAGDAAPGGGAFGGVVPAGSAANLARLGRDQDLRRLQVGKTGKEGIRFTRTLGQ